MFTHDKDRVSEPLMSEDVCSLPCMHMKIEGGVEGGEMWGYKIRFVPCVWTYSWPPVLFVELSMSMRAWLWTCTAGLVDGQSAPSLITTCFLSLAWSWLSFVSLLWGSSVSNRPLYVFFVVHELGYRKYSELVFASKIVNESKRFLI